MHKLLERQLKRLGLTESTSSSGTVDEQSWLKFLNIISDTYREHDQERELVERSMSLVSTELTEKNNELRTSLEELKKKQIVIQFQSNRDILTGLANRKLYLERLEIAIEKATTESKYLAVIFIDLDRFKNINDSFGHSEGDQFLCEVAVRLRECMRPEDTLSRFGGDEFVGLIDNLTDINVAQGIADSLLQAMLVPFSVNNNKFEISGSIGVSIFPEDSSSAQDLIKKADIAMYRAKAGGRNNIRYFDQEMESVALMKIAMERKLHSAIEKNEFSLVYQPIIAGLDGSIVGFEALLRWHPDKGDAVPPDQFIPLAESTGYISSIGAWVLFETCRQIRAWLDANLSAVKVAVNISAKELLSPDFIEQTRKIISEHRIPAGMLEFEITETAIMESIDTVSKKLTELHKIGIEIALDDFGTGYSSLAYLQKLNIQNLKIDKSFILDLTESKQNRKIASAIIALGHSLNLKIVAEGVETSEAFEFLRQKNCDFVQGYYFSRPIPADQATQLLGTDKLNY